MTNSDAATLATRLRRAVDHDLGRLLDISEEESLLRHGSGSGWNRRQELGHLLDSAANNRIRFIVATLEAGYRGPSYDGDGWVELGGYNATTWLELVDLWERLNQSLANVIERVPEQRMESPCQIGTSSVVTLRFLIEDYILHMQHHLDHIVGREKLTIYPGATVGT